MSLGQQCWGCRWRRVRCDSQQPSCLKCTKKGLPCPGYSTTKPLRWRHRVIKHETNDQTLLVLGFQAPVNDDVAPSHVVLDALTYYNAVVVPDLAADGSSSLYTIDISKWAEFNKSKRHLTLCLITLHRAVRELGNVNENQTLFHYHQACAAEILSHKIKTFGQAGPDLELFEDVSLFFFSQIQASAYGAWRAHLNAAKTLFNLWGVEALIGRSDFEFFLCHLVLADVYGTTMAPASHISAEDVSQHKVYLTLLGRFTVDVCSTMVPIPEVVVRATTAINMSRAAGTISDAHTMKEAQGITSSPSAILESLQAFDPTDWALQRPRHTFSQVTSWALLATCFQAAAVLYLVQTCGTNVSLNNEDLVDDDCALFYSRLSKAVRELYDLRQHGGVLYKYILWPMVICGVEAIVRKDEQQLRVLCESLERTTMDLGTLSMREAAIFLGELWNRNIKRVAELPSKTNLIWDDIFDCAPLFLL
ncbi:hypothetical protein BU25DRAFT_373644 [Macroventuria anomochaeta]|uniref:Uncharacterized protein n=1 Tax=Macroventuria anomochaeta TaxID=301207 RepID=A0ACB6RSW6_9PLEO|nr:uncharacterized protein BU25DRAFT_373644 [Macroventuria anomochaeta]KAF2624797.1 hypothetical protein BU25DRAFT_373644 [Macroventuria anomochaeta]